MVGFPPRLRMHQEVGKQAGIHCQSLYLLQTRGGQNGEAYFCRCLTRVITRVKL